MQTVTSRFRGDGVKVIRSTKWKVLFSVAVGFACLMALESLFRALGLGAVTPVSDAIAVWYHSPEGRPFWVWKGKDYNPDGVRDYTHALENSTGAYRIACLGDSVTMGYKIPLEDAYPLRLEAKLREKGVPAEVFNMALPGWSTQQELEAYRKLTRKYKPDIVLLGVCLNDIPEMHNNMLAPPSRTVAWLIRHSAFVRWIVDAQGREVRSIEELFEMPARPAVRSGWKRFFGALKELHAATDADGVPLYVLVFPFRFQLLGDAASPHNPQLMLEKFCQSANIPFFDLLPVLRNLGPSAFWDDSHLSSEGAEAVAKAIAQWLNDRAIPRP